MRPFTQGLFIAALIGLGAVAIQSVASAQPESKAAQPATKDSKAARVPTLIALKFYAEWCPACKAMMPAVKETEKKVGATADQSVLFVTLDQTDKESPQAEYMLAALGMKDLWKENAGKTGYVLLVDPKTKRVVGRLNSDMDAAAMAKAVDAGINACGTGGEHPNADHPKGK